MRFVGQPSPGLRSRYHHRDPPGEKKRKEKGRQSKIGADASRQTKISGGANTASATGMRSQITER